MDSCPWASPFKGYPQPFWTIELALFAENMSEGNVGQVMMGLLV